jgi:hypothetical protein
MDDSMATDADPASEGWEQLMGSDLMLKVRLTIANDDRFYWTSFSHLTGFTP